MDIIKTFGQLYARRIKQRLMSSLQFSQQCLSAFVRKVHALNKINCFLILGKIVGQDSLIFQAAGIGTHLKLINQIIILILRYQAFQITNRVVHIGCLISIPRINSRPTRIPPTLRIAKGRTPHVRNRTVFIRNTRTRNITFIKRTQRQRITISRIYLTRTPFPSLDLSTIRKDVCIR